jgi:hypothetical protein
MALAYALPSNSGLKAKTSQFGPLLIGLVGPIFTASRCSQWRRRRAIFRHSASRKSAVLSGCFEFIEGPRLRKLTAFYVRRSAPGFVALLEAR